MIDFKDKIYIGSNGRKSLFDTQIEQVSKGVFIFVHGYKGFKDWGAWPILQKRFIDNGFGFVKFNMSHNGGTHENPIDFDDLEAFGRNCYSYELHDLNVIIDETYRMIHQECELSIPIYLLGHSRGGGMAILAGNNDKVDGIVSLAGICDIASRFPSGQELLDWKNEGVKYIENVRTHQSMPHFYSFYEDFDKNKESLNIEAAARNLKKPVLIIHGDMDLSVSVSEGLALAEWTSTELNVIKGSDHTFGTKEPWQTTELSEDLNEVVEAVFRFIKN